MASIDLSRFHQTFFEESFEGVQAMEQALLRLDSGAADPEVVNTIFRAAHSIKGGSATFGFSAVAQFTHHLETLLDLVRSGEREVDQPLVDLLLRANDGVRDLLTAARDGVAYDPAVIAALEVELQKAMKRPEAEGAVESAAKADEGKVTGYKLRFAPLPDMFLSGNDPLRIIQELAQLGPLDVKLDMDSLPPLREMTAEQSYVAWDLQLTGDMSETQMREPFAWVEDECDLIVEVLREAAPEPAKVEEAKPAPVAAPAAAKPAEAAPKAASSPTPSGSSEGSSIRVAVDKIDALINLVGELVITQSMLTQNARSLDPLTNEHLINGLTQLETHTRRLQEAVMATRMLPIDAVFSRFPRMIRDLAARLGKDVKLQMVGEGTELDKGVIEKIADPLTHLVRNCVDHGIEREEDRAEAGKQVQGTVTLKAAHHGGQIVIEVIDDGRGLDREKIIAKARSRGMNVSDNASDSEIFALIFAPGFSTADKVTDISGRGVGMDVVKKNIDALGGQVDISSRKGSGTRVTIRLPLTLAILDGMLVSVGKEAMVIPLNCVVESLRPTSEQIRSVVGQERVVRVHGEYVPLVALYQVFNLRTDVRDPEKGIVVVLEAEGRKVALQVDDLLGQQQVVIKSLEANYHRVAGVSGATILGDGHVALIVDAGELVRSTFRAAAA